MEAKIETIISRSVNSCTSGNSISNQVRSISSDDNFAVSAVKYFDYEITDLQKDSFQLYLTDLVEDTTAISSIVVFCSEQVLICSDYPIPVKFMYEIGSLSISSSQLSIVNCDEVDLSELSFHNFQIATGKKATLTISITLR
jgi:hypothetical protein